MKKLFFILAFVMASVITINAQTTVKIGDQTWAGENLNVTTFRNGDSLIETKTEEEWKRALKEKNRLGVIMIMIRPMIKNTENFIMNL